MIIKCPECGHQVSDRAPICPSCGVEIAGHIVKCGNCGEIHLKSDVTCPNCHHNLNAGEAAEEKPQRSTWEDKADWTEKPVQPVRAEPVGQPVQSEPVQTAVPLGDDSQPQPQEEKPKKSFGALVVAFLIAAIVCAVMLYMYHDAQASNELKQYELAMKSTEPAILQAYLDAYHDTNPQHATEVQNKLNFLAQQKHDNKMKEEQEAQDTSDDSDWQHAVSENSADSYARYKLQHPDGKHGAEADEALKKFARETIVTEEDEARAMTAVRTVLRAINGHSQDKLTAAFASSITYNGQDEESPKAVVDFMEHLYNNVDRLNWYLDSGSPKVTKSESQELTITVPARLSQNLKSGNNAQNLFNVRATIDTEGRITAINFTKLATPVAEPKGE